MRYVARLGYALLGACLLIGSACSKYDDQVVRERIGQVEARLTTLEGQIDRYNET